MMVGNFSFNGIKGTDHNLITRSVKRPLLPTAKVGRVNLVGGSGVYDFPGMEYEIRQVTMRVQYIGEDYVELRSRARIIAAWLATDDFKPLIFDDEPDKYYLAKVTSEIDLEHLWESGSANVIFDCQPFAYSINQEVVSINGQSGVVFNPGTRKLGATCPPGSILKLVCTNIVKNTRVVVNRDTSNVDYFIYGSASDSAPSPANLTIDVANMVATIDGGVNAYPHLYGNVDRFFTLQVGNNTVASFVGQTPTPISTQLQFIFNPMWY